MRNYLNADTFFVDHLVAVKGLRPATVRSYRDTIRLFLCFAAADKKVRITKLGLQDLSFERTLGFLRHLEDERHNHNCCGSLKFPTDDH